MNISKRKSNVPSLNLKGAIRIETSNIVQSFQKYYNETKDYEYSLEHHLNIEEEND